MTPQRILFCIPTLEGGGTERQLVYLCHGLSDRGWDVHIALIRYGVNYDRMRKISATFHCIPCRGHYDPGIIWRLRRLIRTIQPDIVQTCITMMDILGGAAACLTHTPWILRERTSARAYAGTLKNLLRVQLASRATAIVANSCSGDTYWQHRVPGDVARYVIRNAVPVEKIQRTCPSDKQALGIETDSKVVLFAGRFVAVKNIENLIASLYNVLTRSNATAVLCGDGPLRPLAEKTLCQYGIEERVQLPGYVSDLWARMKGADVFVSVSFFEGMPNAVAEAMACRCPLVVSDIDQHREILGHDCALFVDPNQPEAIAEAILQVLNQPQEAAVRTEHAIRLASEWSIAGMALQYANVYGDILKRE